MRHEPHKTVIGIFRETIEAWRKREGWSRETVCQLIVEAHERIDGPAATGIHFDPPTRDMFERQKVNAERIFRWLDDVSKDKNLLPPNFQPSIEAAFPVDVLLDFFTARLRGRGIEVCTSKSSGADGFDVNQHIAGLAKEAAEATISLLDVGPAATLPSLERAAKEVKDVEETAINARRAINAEIKRRNQPRCIGCGNEQGIPHVAGCRMNGLAA